MSEKGTNKRFGTTQTSGIALRDACIKRGLMVRAVRDSIVFCPPFVITHDELDRMFAIITASLDEITPLLRQTET